MKKKKILAVTQCFPCGSWLCIEKIVGQLASEGHVVRVLGLGKPSEKNSKFKYHLAPYPSYTKYGGISSGNPFFNLLLSLPLYFMTFFWAVFFNYQIVIYNGLAVSLVLAPFFKLLGKKNIIMYHTTLNDVGDRTKKILKRLFGAIDLVVVNSQNSAEDLRGISTPSKIFINEHYADEVFFETEKKNKPHKQLRVVYAGRIDHDKRCFPLIDFAKTKKDDPDFEFTFVGGGAEVDKVVSLATEYPHIKYGGYIHEKGELAKFFSKSDVVWGFADTSYLGLPPVEALATDTPIVVPSYAAIAHKDELIDKNLVPESIGWLVDPFDPVEIKKTMERIQSRKSYLGKKCRDFAQKRYSSKNLAETIERIKREIAK